jgi:hypothetical protein
VPELIAGLAQAAASGTIAGQYLPGDITCDALPFCDTILCRDCLVHLSYENIGRAIANFRMSGAAFLITTTFPAWQANSDCEDGDWWALNFEHAPFRWGRPLITINEECGEAGGGWSDKSLGVWRLAELPLPD